MCDEDGSCALYSETWLQQIVWKPSMLREHNLSCRMDLVLAAAPQNVEKRSQSQALREAALKEEPLSHYGTKYGLYERRTL